MKRICIILVIALVLLTGCAAKENEALVQETELAENEINNSPTYTITKSELVGIWRNNLADTHRGFFYFTSSGYVYYQASKSEPNQNDFTSEYLLATSYSLNGYNRTTGAYEGSFYNKPLKMDATFSVTKDSARNLSMEMTSGVASGTYKKTG